MTILDSNVWIAFLNESDSQHKKAEKVFNVILLPIGMPEYIIAEVASVLAMRASKTIADKFIDIALDNQDIQIIFSSRSFFTGAMESFKNSKQKQLSFVDSVLLYLSQNHEIITFDENLRKAIAAKKRQRAR